MNLIDLNMREKEIEDKANFLVKTSKELKYNPSPQKDGGYLNIFLNGFQEEKGFKIGLIPPEDIEKYWGISQEKAYRVYSHWLRAPYLDKPIQVFLSYQSRNPDEKQYGGAVLFDDKSKLYFIKPQVVTFSGLSEQADEALSYVIGKDLGFDKEKGLIKKIKKISNNRLVDEMVNRFDKEYGLAA